MLKARSDSDMTAMIRTDIVLTDDLTSGDTATTLYTGLRCRMRGLGGVLPNGFATKLQAIPTQPL